jgi:hypothetical protein
MRHEEDLVGLARDSGRTAAPARGGAEAASLTVPLGN